MQTDKNNIARTVSILANEIRRRMDAMSAKTPYSGAQSRALHFILANQDVALYQKDIEAVFGLRPSSASSVLRKMEENGLIRREVCADDARMKQIISTEQAKACSEQVLKDLEDLERDLVKGITEEEINTFFSVINQMTDNLR